MGDDDDAGAFFVWGQQWYCDATEYLPKLADALYCVLRWQKGLINFIFLPRTNLAQGFGLDQAGFFYSSFTV